MADITEEILTSLRTIDSKVDGIDKKVAVYGKSIIDCERDRDSLFKKTNGMRTDITVLKTQKKTSENVNKNRTDRVLVIISIILSIVVATFVGMTTLGGAERAPEYCNCAEKKYCVCNKDVCGCVECRIATTEKEN